MKKRGTATYQHNNKYSVTSNNIIYVKECKKRLIQGLTQLFNNLNIRFVIGHGNLIEYTRGKPIYHDDDIDIRFCHDDYSKWEEFCNNNNSILPKYNLIFDKRFSSLNVKRFRGFQTWIIEYPEFKDQEFKKNMNIHADVVSSRYDGEFWLDYDIDFDNLRKIKYLGIETYAPNIEDTHYVLSKQYGDYMIPDRKNKIKKIRNYDDRYTGFFFKDLELPIPLTNKISFLKTKIKKKKNLEEQRNDSILDILSSKGGTYNIFNYLGKKYIQYIDTGIKKKAVNIFSGKYLNLSKIFYKVATVNFYTNTIDIQNVRYYKYLDTIYCSSEAVLYIIKNRLDTNKIKKVKIKLCKVLTCGTFDLFHKGHKNILNYCSSLGKAYIGVSTDEVNLQKGKESIDNIEKRISNVSKSINNRFVFRENRLDKKEQYISIYNVDIFVIGDDWKDQFNELSCTVLYVPRTPNISTTLLKQQLN